MIDRAAHIVVIRDKQVPEKMLDTFCGDVNSEHLRLQKIQQPERGPQASLAWLAIPAIAILILKPYFTGFLDEAGRDHYLILKKALHGLWGKVFSSEHQLQYAAMAASGKKTYNFSMLFSVYAFTNDGLRVKLLLPADCSEVEFSESIDAFLDFMELYYRSDRVRKSEIDMEHAKSKLSQILVEYDWNRKMIIPVDPIPNDIRSS